MEQFYLITGLIFLFNIGLKCQEYVPFPKSNVNWNVYIENTMCSDTDYKEIYRYTICGDTIINEIQYNRLCLETGVTHNSKVTIGGIREKDKKIYFLEQFVGKELLLYDFTAQIGDTVWHEEHSFHSIILDIDSVLFDSSYRKRYKVDNNNWDFNNPDYIIEGIGSVKNGLLGNTYIVTACGNWYWEHICFQENGEVKYLNPSYKKCFPDNLITSVDNFKSDNNFEFFPNPVNNEFIIVNNTDNSILRIRLININGRILTEKNIEYGYNNIEFTIEAGIYNVLIVDNQGKILATKKVIKN